MTPIPDTAHFIWYGSRFPWVNGLAIRSLATCGQLGRIVLHHDDALNARELDDLPPAVELSPIRYETHFAPLGPRAQPLYALHQALQSPAAKANIVRMCVLGQQGGVYLDLDTITIKPLTPLLEDGVFCGREHVLFTAELYDSYNPLRWAGAVGLSGLRFLLRELPRGHAHFSRVAPLYPTAVNNAIVGAAAGHPFVFELLDAMLAMPSAQQQRRYALGTHLLQRRVATYQGTDLTIHAPPVFFPLPPEICLHWFRQRAGGDPKADLRAALSPHTRVVHWYASNRNQALTDRLDAAYVRAHRRHQMFSALAADFLD